MRSRQTSTLLWQSSGCAIGQTDTVPVQDCADRQTRMPLVATSQGVGVGVAGPERGGGENGGGEDAGHERAPFVGKPQG